METQSIYETEDLAAIRAQTRRFVENEVVPYGDEWEVQGGVPRELYTKLGEIGLFGLRIPESRGGVGLGHLASATVAEEFGEKHLRRSDGQRGCPRRVGAALPLPLRIPELQDKYLPGMMTGELIGALAVSEAPTPVPMWRP